MRKPAFLIMLLLALACIGLVDQAAMADKKDTVKATADLCIDNIYLDASDYINITLRNCGKGKISPASLVKASLIITAGKHRQSVSLSKIDPKAKLANPGAKLTYRVPEKIKAQTTVSATLITKGLFDESNTKNNSRTATLKPAPSKPVTTVQAKPTAQTTQHTTLTPTTGLVTASKPTASVKPVATVGPVVAAARATPPPTPAVVRVKGITLVDGTVRVTLERQGPNLVATKDLSAARLTVMAGSKRHNFSLYKVDPAGRGLNGSKRQAEFDTGIKLEESATVRAQLSGIGVTSIKTARLAVKPAPKPLATPAAVKPTTVKPTTVKPTTVKPVAQLAQAKITVSPQSIAITPGKSAHANLRGAQAAKATKARILLNGKPVKGLSATLANGRLQISGGSPKLPSGQYEVVLLDRADNEIQRLAMGLSFSQAAPTTLGGEITADRVISGQMVGGWNQQELANGWAREMYQAGLLQVRISPNAGQFSIRNNNLLRWGQLPPGSYTITITAPDMWSIINGQQTIVTEEQYSHLSTITVTPRYRIHGTINNNEDPAQGISQVRVQRLNSSGQGGVVRAVSLDQGSGYTIIVDAGRYKIAPVVPENTGLPQPVERTVTVPYGSRQDLQVDFDLSRDTQTRAVSTPQPVPSDSGPIRGVVLYADGSPAEGVTINIMGVEHPSVTTDENGEFQTQGIRNNVYVTVIPQKANWTFQPGRIAASANDSVQFTITPTARARFVINGTIQADSRPLAGVTVNCGGHTTTTGQSGVFAFRNLPQGQYVVRPELEGYTFEPAVLNFVISDRDMLNNYFVGRRIAPSGNAFIAGNLWTLSAGTGHGGLGGEQVKLYYCTGGNDPNCTARAVVAGNGEAVTESDGHFVFLGLGQGRYAVVPPAVLSTRYAGNFQPAERVVNISGQSVSGVDFIRGSGEYNAQSINGRFTSLDGGQLPDGITLRVETCNTVHNPTCQRTDAQVRINADGTFIIWDVPPGIVKLSPMGTNLTFEPASMLMTNHAETTDFGGQYFVRRDMGGSSVGSLSIQIGLSRNLDSYPSVVWQVEYLGQGDMTETARQWPQAIQAQSQRQVASDPVTGQSLLSNLATGTYKISPRSVTPQNECVISPEASFIFIAPGANYARFSAAPAE